MNLKERQISLSQKKRKCRHSLHKPVTLAAALLLFLELHELQLAERLKDVLEIVLRDGEVDVANVETVERNAVGLSSSTLRSASLTVLLCFGELGNDRNS